jgi:hypothetical protein
MVAGRYPEGTSIVGHTRQEARRRVTVGAGCRPSRRSRRGKWGSWRRVAEAALPGGRRHRADAGSPAELGDSEAAVTLTPDLASPPLLPRPAICRRSESDHDLSPGDDKLGSADPYGDRQCYLSLSSLRLDPFHLGTIKTTEHERAGLAGCTVCRRLGVLPVWPHCPSFGGWVPD